MQRSQPTDARDANPFDGLSQQERAVVQAIRGTSYGAVEVVVHHSRIVEIVKTEKLRLAGSSSSQG